MDGTWEPPQAGNEGTGGSGGCSVVGQSVSRVSRSVGIAAEAAIGAEGAGLDPEHDAFRRAGPGAGTGLVGGSETRRPAGQPLEGGLHLGGGVGVRSPDG